jgi:hypothetical protein
MKILVPLDVKLFELHKGYKSQFSGDSKYPVEPVMIDKQGGYYCHCGMQEGSEDWCDDIVEEYRCCEATFIFILKNGSPIKAWRVDKES